MPVSQQFIALLNLSVPHLKLVARRAGIVVEGDTHWDLAMGLSELPHAQLEEIAGDWLYAGRTSVTWFAIDGGAPIEHGRVRAALTAMYDEDPLENEIRPAEVTKLPQLVDARVWTREKIVLTFVASRRLTRIIHNFEAEEVEADEFFLALLRLPTGTLEVRASYERAKQLASQWLPEFAGHLATP